MLNFQVNKNEFITALANTVASASQDPSRVSLIGVNMAINDDTVELVGTDGYKLIRRVVSIDNVHGSIEESITVEVSILQKIIKAHSKKDRFSVIIVELDSNSLVIDGVKCELIEDVYPNIDKDISSDFKQIILKAIPTSYLTKFVSTYKKVAPKSELVFLESVDGVVTFNVKNTECGITGCIEICNCDTDFKVGFNVVNLLLMLKQIQSQKRARHIDIKIADMGAYNQNRKPVFITSRNDRDREVYLIMPLLIVE